MQSQRITDADLTYGRRDLEQTTFVPAFVALDGQVCFQMLNFVIVLYHVMCLTATDAAI